MKRTLALLSTVGLLYCAPATHAQMQWQLVNETYNSVTYKFQGLPTSWLTADHMVDWSLSSSYEGDVSAVAAPHATFGAPYPTLGMQRVGGGLGFATEADLNGPLIVAWAVQLDLLTAGAGIYKCVGGTENLDGFALPISGTSSWVTLFPDATEALSITINGIHYSGTATYSSMGQDQDNDGAYFGIVTFTIPSLPPTAAPEIAVEQPAGTDLVDGTASIDLSSVVVGSSSAATTFTIKNTGTANLTVGTITKDGANPGDFTVDTTGMSATVAAGGNTTFTVTFTPGATGARSAAIHIANNDSDENPFDIALTGTGTVPSGPTANPDSIDRPTTARVVKVLRTALLANDHPLPLTIAAVGNPLPAGATVILSGPFVVYTAPAADAGDGSFEYTASDGSATAVGTVTVNEVGPSGPNAQNAVKIEVSGGNAVITFIGVPGRNYQVQRAGAVTGPWTDLGGVLTAPASGVLTYTDSSPPSPSFYRIILVP